MAIAYVTSSANWIHNISSGAAAISLPTTVAAGSCIVVVVGYTSVSTGLVSGIVDNASGGSNTYTRIIQVRESTSSVVCELWSTPASVVHGSITTVTPTCSNSGWSAAAAAYSGVSALGTNNTATLANSTSAGISLTTEDVNDFVVAGLAVGSTDVLASSVGNLEIQSAGGTPVVCLLDNTFASISLVSNFVTHTNPAFASCACVDLRLIASLPNFLATMGCGK